MTACGGNAQNSARPHSTEPANARPSRAVTSAPQKTYTWPADPKAISPCELVNKTEVRPLLGNGPAKAARFQNDVSGYGHVNHCAFKRGDDFVEIAVDQDTEHAASVAAFQSLYQPRRTASGDEALQVTSLGPPTGAMLTANDTLNLEVVVYSQDSWLLSVQVVRNSLPNDGRLLPEARSLLAAALTRYGKIS